MEDNSYNEIVYRKFKKGGSLCIKVPLNTSYKDGDIVDVHTLVGRIDRGRALGEFVGENEYGRYYLKVE